MTVMLACVLCELERPLNGDGLCANSGNPEDPRPRFNACADLVSHIGSSLARTGRARLRTNTRSSDEAKRLLLYSSREFTIRFVDGDSWVEAFVDGDAVQEQPVLAPPRRVVDGFVIDNLDIGKMHMDLIEAKRKASLYREMAQVEDGWHEAAVEAQAAAKQLAELIDAWEVEHDQS